MANTELLKALQDARARRESEYQWEKLRLNQGGSKIAMGQCRRDADAISQAAIIISNSASVDTGPRWYHWGILTTCVVVTVVMTILGA